jgi:hypothetical protein
LLTSLVSKAFPKKKKQEMKSSQYVLVLPEEIGDPSGKRKMETHRKKKQIKLH